MLKSRPLLRAAGFILLYQLQFESILFTAHSGVQNLPELSSGHHDKERVYEKIISDVAFDFKRAAGAGD